MSHLKYIVLGALSLGALAIEPGTAEAALQNVTEAWCKPTGAEDQVIVAGASSTLIWKSSGELVLEPNNRVAPRIWSSGTAGAGARLCWSAAGVLSVHHASGATLWSRGDGVVPAPPIGDFRYEARPSLSGCTLSARYTVSPLIPAIPWFSVPTIEGQLWSEPGTCPEVSPTVAGNGWCMDTSASRTIVQNRWAELRWMTYGQLVLRATPGIRHHQLIWESPVDAQLGKKLCFEDTGRLAIYDAAGQAIWQTAAGAATSGHTLALDDCNLTINPLTGGAPIWTSSNRCPQTRLQLFPGELNQITLLPGTTDEILLENDRARLALQPDGNLVLRSVSGDEVWHSGLPANRGKRLSFQADGNLVIYDAANVPLWAPNVHDQGVSLLDLDGCAFGLKSPTATKWSQGMPTCPTSTITNTPAWSAPASGVLTVLRTPDSRLVWQGDGNLVLYTATGAPVWATNTWGHGKKLSFKANGNLVVSNASGNLWASGTTLVGDALPRVLILDRHCKLSIRGDAFPWYGSFSCTVVNYSYENAQGSSTIGVVVHTHLTATSNGSARLDSRTGIDVTIFDHDEEVLSATGYQIEGGGDSDPDAATALEILGESADLNLAIEVTFLERSQTFNVGPVPVTVTATATGEVGLAASFTDGALKLTPTARLDATVRAGVGADCGVASASAGIQGTVNLLELGLPIRLELFMSDGLPRYRVKGDLTIGTLSGALSLYAEATVGVWPAEYSGDWSHEIFRWDGYEESANLFEKTGGF